MDLVKAHMTRSLQDLRKVHRWDKKTGRMMVSKTDTMMVSLMARSLATRWAASKESPKECYLVSLMERVLDKMKIQLVESTEGRESLKVQ